MKVIPLIACLFLLNGCVAYKWVKPGNSEEQESMQETSCEAQALRDLPPNYVLTESHTEKKKDKKKKKEESDVSYTQTDENMYKRDTLVEDCMFKNGWKEVEDK